MKIEFKASVVFVKNIEIAKSFYMSVLKQEIEHDFGENIIFKSGIALWEISSEHLLKNASLENEHSNKFELYFETETLKETELKLKELNIKFLHEIITEFWNQKTLRFFDPDNHLIEIGEKMENLYT